MQDCSNCSVASSDLTPDLDMFEDVSDPSLVTSRRRTFNPFSSPGYLVIHNLKYFVLWSIF